jgi:hypothetical protein
MPEITLRHEIDTDEDTFWSKIVFDESFNKKLYLDELKFPQWKLLEMKDDDAKISRRVLVEPATKDLPAPLKKALGGDALAYTEEGTFDKKARRYSFTVRPSMMPDKTKVSGELWVEKLGDKKIRRLCKIAVEVKVFMIGGMVEDRILKDLQQSYDASTVATNKYIKEHGL